MTDDKDRDRRTADRGVPVERLQEGARIRRTGGPYSGPSLTILKTCPHCAAATRHARRVLDTMPSGTKIVVRVCLECGLLSELTAE